MSPFCLVVLQTSQNRWVNFGPDIFSVDIFVAMSLSIFGTFPVWPMLNAWPRTLLMYLLMAVCDMPRRLATSSCFILCVRVNSFAT